MALCDGDGDGDGAGDGEIASCSIGTCSSFFGHVWHLDSTMGCCDCSYR